jgi:hypothetical protein
MAINVGELASKMAAAALGVLKDKGPAVKTFAEGEFAKLAQTIATIEQGRLLGTIKEDEAVLLLDMQKHATRTVLAAVEGMSLLVAEQAINAALDVVRVAVNTALKFALL